MSAWSSAVRFDESAFCLRLGVSHVGCPASRAGIYFAQPSANSRCRGVPYFREAITPTWHS